MTSYLFFQNISLTHIRTHYSFIHAHIRTQYSFTQLFDKKAHHTKLIIIYFFFTRFVSAFILNFVHARHHTCVIKLFVHARNMTNVCIDHDLACTKHLSILLKERFISHNFRMLRRWGLIAQSAIEVKRSIALLALERLDCLEDVRVTVANELL